VNAFTGCFLFLEAHGPGYDPKKASLAPILLFFSIYAFGQDADFFKSNPHRRELKAVKITGNIKLDGVLDEPEWNLTLGASEFIQVEPYQASLQNLSPL
jgi:hypothetical protein